MSESDILGAIDYLSDNNNLVSFERAMFQDTERKYSYYLCQYHHFEGNAWIIINDVHDKYKGDTFLSIHLGLVSWDNFEKIW